MSRQWNPVIEVHCFDGKNVRDHFGIYELPFEGIYVLLCE